MTNTRTKKGHSSALSQHFPGITTQFYWNQAARPLPALPYCENTQLWVVEEGVHAQHPALFTHAPLHLLPGGEQHKKWTALEDLLHHFVERGVQRGSPLLGVGGGAQLDLVAFAASIYHRGTPFIAVPSTLLAMVDAAIGGKTGINFAGYKNLLGTIVQPSAWVLDMRLLSSLPASGWADGFAEIIKYACIGDISLFDTLCATNWQAYRADETKLQPLIARCVAHKARIVAADAHDTQGIRIHLNFGHSLGHALERCCGCSHGSAVACGMAFATWLSAELGVLPHAKYVQLCTLLPQYGLPTHMVAQVDDLLEGLKKDKKCTDKSIQWVLLQDIGKACVQELSFAYIRKQLLRYQQEYS